ncbi:DegQ family serine endoprotease [Amorphus sp. 3PC139-8]|uniref:DegQ family serine endoprotease n=1 Tax=Amorphus sp. 3PC139-8 TaxID=2735676 RepID=UPI00345CAD0A
MRLAQAAGIALVAAFVTGPAVAQGPQSVADIAEPLFDSVVNISTSQEVTGRRSMPMPKIPEGSPFQEFFDEFFDKQQEQDNRPRKVQSLGSGFVISEDGLIVTNNHVIEDADEITVNFNDDTSLEATVLGHDPKTDLALLKVEPDKPLKALEFGSSDALRIGDWVMAIGNPFGLSGTLSVGVVSARDRDINSGPYDDYLQTDAAINRGNSGGPLFNMQGQVVGVNTAIISPSGGSIGIGFAIPSEIAMHVVDQLREYGETRRGWLGVRIQTVTDDIADSLGMDGAKGALVAGVTDDGPAEKAGIEAGDVILSFNGEEVPSMRDLPRMVADTDIGRSVDVVVLRKGEEVTVPVELGRLEEAEETVLADESTGSDNGSSETEESQTEVLGMTVSDISAKQREEFDLGEDIEGVLVVEVDPDGPAAEKRVQAGDVIVEVAQEPVATPKDVADQVAKLKEDGRKTALLLLSNGSGELRFVAVRLED